MQIGEVIPLTVGLLHGIDFLLVTLSSLGGKVRKIFFTRFSFEAEYCTLVNTIAKFLWFVGYYMILELITPLQVQSIVTIKCYNNFFHVPNILRQVATFFVTICFRVHFSCNLSPHKTRELISSPSLLHQDVFMHWLPESSWSLYSPIISLNAAVRI